MLLYRSFDSGDAKVARDLTGKTKGGIINGVAKIVQGIRGKALELDGASGYLEIELTPDMVEAERNSYTAELWLKTKAQAPDVAVYRLVKRLRGHLVFGGYGPEEHFYGHWSMYLQNGDNLSFYTINISSHTSGGPQRVVADNTFHLNDTQPLVPIDVPRHPVEVVRAIYKSAEERQPVTLPLDKDDPFYGTTGRLTHGVKRAQV